MKLVYVAGKFRGKTPWDVHNNVAAAEAASLDVALAGAMPVVPQKNTEHFDGLLTGQFWIDGTLELMRRCDAVYVFNESHLDSSVGTQGEVAEAIRLGLPVLIGLRAFQEWAAK